MQDVTGRRWVINGFVVDYDGKLWHCPCPDFDRKGTRTCSHIEAAATDTAPLIQLLQEDLADLSDLRPENPDNARERVKRAKLIRDELAKWDAQQARIAEYRRLANL